MSMHSFRDKRRLEISFLCLSKYLVSVKIIRFASSGIASSLCTLYSTRAPFNTAILWLDVVWTLFTNMVLTICQLEKFQNALRELSRY